MNQCFQDFFIGFVIVVHLVTIKNIIIIISVKPEYLLKAEAIKNRYNIYIYIRNHPNITIKKADKTNIFVVLNKTDYHSKLQNILDAKFKKYIPPTNIYKLILLIAELNSIKLPKIIGD